MPIVVADRDQFSPQEMVSVFGYNPETGLLTWRVDTCRGRHKAGTPAGCIKPNGYVRIQYQKKHLFAHRVAWAIHYGEWPAELVDHINKDRSDNRAENLRAATHSQNMRNRKTHKHSKTGVRGVAFEGGSYRASITTNGKRVRLGFFQSIEAASAAYMSASESIHGAFGAAASPAQPI